MTDWPVRSHSQRLDFRHGVASRETVWELPGGPVRVESRRIAHMTKPHLLASRYTVSADFPAEIELFADIDRDIWEIYGPHYGNMQFQTEGDALLCLASVQNGKDMVAVGRRCILSKDAQRTPGEGSFTYRLTLEPDCPVSLTSVCAVYTTADVPDPMGAVKAELAGAAGWDGLLASHSQAWEAIWARGAAARMHTQLAVSFPAMAPSSR